jgi:hypothetical protein
MMVMVMVMVMMMVMMMVGLPSTLPTIMMGDREHARPQVAVRKKKKKHA